MPAINRLLILLTASLLLGACSSDEPQKDTSRRRKDSPQKAPAARIESEEELRLSSLKEQYARIESYAASNPRQLQTILTQVDGFKAQASGTAMVKKAEELASKAQDRFNEEAQSTFEKLREKAQKALEGGKTLEALEILGEYPAEFSSTQWQNKIEEMSGPIEAEAEADRKLDFLKERVKEELEKHNPELALQLVNGYPQDMRTGSRKAEWEKLHGELTSVVDKARELQSKEDALPWDELFTGDNMDKWSPQSGSWELQGGSIVGKCAAGSQGFMYCGTEESPWDNFILELEFKIVSGDYLVLGIRGKNEGGKSVYDQIGLYTDNFPRGKFHRVAIEIRGSLFTVRPQGGGVAMTQQAEPGYTKGPLCFFILDDSEVHIRKARIKLLK